MNTKGDELTVVDDLMQTSLSDDDTMLDNVLGDENIKKFSKDGEWSKEKIGLVAAVVTFMQDRLLLERNERISDAKSETRRLHQMVSGGVRAFFATRVISSPVVSDDSDSNGLREKVLQWFTWGNVSASAAVIAICSFAWFSGSYANYKKEAVENAATVKRLLSEKDDLTKKISDFQSENTRLTAERDSANKTSEMYQNLSETSNSRAFDTGTTVGQLQSENQALLAGKTDLETRIAKLDGQMQYQTKIATRAQKDYKDQVGLTTLANQEIIRLQATISDLKTKCGSRCN